MSDIAVRQNKPLELERLGAMRELYSEAKRVQNLQILLTVILPVCFAAVGIFAKNFPPVGAAYALVIAVLNQLFLEPSLKEKRKVAAKIQDQFACSVFSLDCSTLRPNDDVSQEKIREYYQRHLKNGGKVDKLENWYTDKLGPLPIEYERLVCQRSDIAWDNGLRERFTLTIKRVLFISIGTLFVTYFVMALINEKFDFIRFVLIANSLLPFILYCAKLYTEHSAATARLKQLISFGNSLWNQARNRTLAGDELTAQSRRLQDEIYDHRSASPLIPDWAYWRRRDADEETLEDITARRIEEIKTALGV